jgi:hypothetical protein
MVTECAEEAKEEGGEEDDDDAAAVQRSSGPALVSLDGKRLATGGSTAVHDLRIAKVEEDSAVTSPVE